MEKRGIARITACALRPGKQHVFCVLPGQHGRRRPGRRAVATDAVLICCFVRSVVC